MDCIKHLLVVVVFYEISIPGVFNSASNDCPDKSIPQTDAVQLRKQDKNDVSHESFSLRNHAVGRHVCRYERVIMKPHQGVQSYCKPAYLTYLRKCEGNNEGFCTEYRLVYELAHRNVQKMVAETEIFFSCCPGWSKVRLSAKSCKKAICVRECQNGGSCLKPNRCACLPGWTGKFCQKDIDECELRPRRCEQVCINWPGSYKCSCHDGFLIESDGITCKRPYPLPSEETTWIQKYENLSAKVMEIEQQLGIITDLNQRVQTLADDIDYLKNQTADEQKSRSEDLGIGRINSLSEQMAIIEERLAECSCNSPARTPLRRPSG